MSAQSDLQEAYTNVCRLIKEITASPKPSYRVGDVSYDHAEYLKILTEQEKALRQVSGSDQIACVISQSRPR